MPQEIINNICEFWIDNYLNLHEPENRDYKQPVWRYKLTDIEPEKNWIVEWEQPCASLPISIATAKVYFNYDSDKKSLSMRYESQQLENMLSLDDKTPSLDIQKQIKRICDSSLFNPLVQLSQIVKSKEVVSQFIRQEKWLSGCSIYQKHNNAEDIAHAGLEDKNIDQFNMLHNDVSQAMKALDHVPTKIIQRLGSKTDKTIEFYDRLTKLKGL